MSESHDYDTTTVRGSDLDNTHCLVGESGGLSAVYGNKASGFGVGLRSVETEHGLLLLDPDGDFLVLVG